MEASQYRLDDNAWHEEANLLLDDEGMPADALPNGNAKSLANIASAIYLNSQNLSESQIERVVIWLKQLKISQNWPTGTYPGSPQDGFYRLLTGVRESSEQVAFQKKANMKALKSNVAAVLLFICVLATVAMSLADVAKWMTAIPGILSFVAFGFMQSYTKEAFIIAKEQDRRYVMQCLRFAENVDELNEAGLFMYLPGMQIDANYDEQTARAAAKKEVERLRDALYTRSRLLED